MIPSSLGGAPVTAIGASAFEGKKNLTTVSMPSFLKAIGEEAYRDCENLTTADHRKGAGQQQGQGDLQNQGEIDRRGARGDCQNPL